MDILCSAVEHVLQPPRFTPMTAPAVFTLLPTLLPTQEPSHAALGGLLYKDPYKEIMTILLNANGILTQSHATPHTELDAMMQIYKLKHHYSQPRVLFYLSPAVQNRNVYVNHIDGPIVSCLAHIGADGYTFDELCTL